MREAAVKAARKRRENDKKAEGKAAGKASKPIPIRAKAQVFILLFLLFIVILQQNSNFVISYFMNIENEICSSVIRVVKELYGQEVAPSLVQLQKTRSNFEGNLTLVVFPFLKISKKKTKKIEKI